MNLDKLAGVVLPDITPYILGGSVLTGSSAYRLLLKLDEKPVQDLDLIIFPNQRTPNPLELLSPRVKEKFYITILLKNPRGYRYGLVHKGSYGWVDLFPRRKKPSTIPIDTSLGRLDVEVLEGIAWGLCVSALERAQNNQRIIFTSLDKIRFLKPFLDTDKFSEICFQNLSETTPEVGSMIKKFKGTALLDYVLKHCRPYDPPGFDLYNNRESTPSGLTVEDEPEFCRIINHHHKIWPDKIL